jgi:hypothetical protein
MCTLYKSILFQRNDIDIVWQENFLSQFAFIYNV